MKIAAYVARESVDIRRLLGRVEDASRGTAVERSRALAALDERLSANLAAERELLLRIHGRGVQRAQTIEDAIEDGFLVRQVLHELQELSPDPERWPTKFRFLRELIERHLAEQAQNLGAGAVNPRGAGPSRYPN